MSLNWNFKTDYIGEWREIYKATTCVYKVYKCNGLAVVLYETKKTYQVHTFFADEKHLKNCLGITKGCQNIFDDPSYDLELSLDNSKISKKILKNFVSADWKEGKLKIITNETPF